VSVIMSPVGLTTVSNSNLSQPQGEGSRISILQEKRAPVLRQALRILSGDSYCSKAYCRSIRTCLLASPKTDRTENISSNISSPLVAWYTSVHRTASRQRPLYCRSFTQFLVGNRSTCDNTTNASIGGAKLPRSRGAVWPVSGWILNLSRHNMLNRVYYFTLVQQDIRCNRMMLSWECRQCTVTRS
jgi:hypothetical protein